MKQKILFMMIDMNVGGTEKAFLNLVSEMDFTKYGVTLLLLEAKGGFLKDVPKEVQIETLENYEQIKDEIMLPPLECAKKFWKLKNYSESVGILLHHFIFKISIEEYELKDTVILLGTKTNPYRFYKDATIYVQTSRHEGFGITIAEAKVFKLPIVSTDVAGAREQLKEKNEIIVQFAPEELAKGIKKLLEKLRG